VWITAVAAIVASMSALVAAVAAAARIRSEQHRLDAILAAHLAEELARRRGRHADRSRLGVPPPPPDPTIHT